MKSLPRLILCEGLPGSGKTTTTQQLWLHLESLGHPARWWFEHELGHPVLAFDDARAAQQAGGEEARAIFERTPARWAALAAATGGITLIEGALFQATAGAQLLADRPHAEITAHFDRVQDLITPLAPALIYLRQADVAAGWRATCTRRGAWFPEFLRGEFAATARGRREGRSDDAAILDYLRERQALCDGLFERFRGAKLRHDNTDADWARQAGAITTFLGLPAMTGPVPPLRAHDYAGRFRAETGDAWTVVAEAAGLRLTGDQPARLLPHGPDRFVVEALCIEVTFRRDAAGVVTRLECAGNLPALPVHWSKV